MDLLAWLETLFAAGYGPFLLSGFLVAGLFVLEMLSLLIGHSFFGMDADFEFEPGAFASAMDWLHLGKVPFAVTLTLLLTFFALLGGGAHALLSSLLPSGLSSWIASGLGLAGSLLSTRAASAVLARAIPMGESYAVSSAELLGNSAELLADASEGSMAQARVVNHLGESLYVYLEPDSPGALLPKGSKAILTRQLSMNRFLARAVPSDPALPSPSEVPR